MTNTVLSNGEMAPVVIPDRVKSEPSYADGYYAAFHGGSFDLERADDQPYAYGFEAGNCAVKLFESNGFKRCQDGFAAKFRIGKRP